LPIINRSLGLPLVNVRELENPSDLYDQLMKLIVRLARYGLIHGDFNEYNLMLTNVRFQFNNWQIFEFRKER
jgi:RIO kinase 2